MEVFWDVCRTPLTRNPKSQIGVITSAYQSFEVLEVWQRACRLSVRIYEALQDCMDIGLKNQMTRAAVSIASNIAEGLNATLALNLSAFFTSPKDGLPS